MMARLREAMRSFFRNDQQHQITPTSSELRVIIADALHDAALPRLIDESIEAKSQKDAAEFAKLGHLCLAISVIAALIGAPVAYQGIALLEDPQQSSKSGAIQVAFGQKRLTDPEIQGPVGVVIHHSSNIVQYTLLFTDSMVGADWSLTLQGNARIGLDRLAPEVHASQGRCFDDPCEYIYGKVEKPLTQLEDGTGQTLDDNPVFDPLLCSPFRKIPFSAFLELEGRSFSTNRQNWATQSIGLPASYERVPYAVGFIPFEGPPIKSMADDISSTIVDIQPCEIIDVPEGYEVADTAPDPSYRTAAAISWTSMPTSQISAAFRRTDANLAANSAIVFSGLCFAVTTGCLPVWIQGAFLNRRRRRKPRT